MKKKKNIIIIFIIIAILILFAIIRHKTTRTDVVENLGTTEVAFTEYSVSTKSFDEVLSSLPIPSIDMRKKIQDFSIVALKQLKNAEGLDKQKALAFYEKNKLTLEEYIYQFDYEVFQKIVKLIGEIKVDELVYTGSSFDLATLDVKNEDKTVELVITYNNSYDLKFIVHIDTMNDNKILFELIEESN